MALRVGWDIYETAILLDACIQIEQGKCDRKEMIKKASVALRKRAESKGVSIDELFRNENGITLQMSKMLFLVSSGKKGLPGAGKNFVQLSELYKTDLLQFDEILKSAKKQIYLSKGKDMDNEIKKDENHNHNNLLSKLYYLSKVYDNPQGISVTRILEQLGNNEGEDEIRNVLDNVEWATYIGNDLYSFSNSAVLKNRNEDKQIDADDFDRSKYISVLMSRYRNGMQFDSIDFDNFREVYLDMWNEEIKFNDYELEERLHQCGVLFKERLFPAEGIMDDKIKNRLFEYISNSFSQGKKVLYYKAIFEDLSDEFVYCFNLTNDIMLREYMKFADEEHKYFYFNEYMSVEEKFEINHLQEISDFMLAEGKPLSYEEIHAGVSHLSMDLVYREIQKNGSFIRDAKEHYFHEVIFEVSDEELSRISETIEGEIQEKGYAIWSNIYRWIEDNMPVFLENNLYLSSLGIRNALIRLLNQQYNFESSIICEAGKQLTMSDVYKLYAEHHLKFTDNDIYDFSKEVDCIIYFPALYEKAIRVSRSQFVSKNLVNINVEAVDAAIETYFSGDYIPLKDIDSFLVFPNEGFEWNEFLLEGFLTSYSKKYVLLNNGFSLKNAAGAVVRKASSIENFEDVCSCALAQSDVELNKDSALDYLIDINFITRKSYKNIESAISRALRMRNRKE